MTPSPSGTPTHREGRLRWSTKSSKARIWAAPAAMLAVLLAVQPAAAQSGEGHYAYQQGYREGFRVGYDDGRYNRRYDDSFRGPLSLYRDDPAERWRQQYSRLYTYQDDAFYRECRRSPDPAGVIVGALIGGLLGGAIGDGDAVPTVAGVILGGTVGAALTQNLDCDDRSYAYRAYYDGLNAGYPHRTLDARNTNPIAPHGRDHDRIRPAILDPAFVAPGALPGSAPLSHGSARKPSGPRHGSPCSARRDIAASLKAPHVETQDPRRVDTALRNRLSRYGKVATGEAHDNQQADGAKFGQRLATHKTVSLNPR